MPRRALTGLAAGNVRVLFRLVPGTSPVSGCSSLCDRSRTGLAVPVGALSAFWVRLLAVPYQPFVGRNNGGKVECTCEIHLVLSQSVAAGGHHLAHDGCGGPVGPKQQRRTHDRHRRQRHGAPGDPGRHLPLDGREQHPRRQGNHQHVVPAMPGNSGSGMTTQRGNVNSGLVMTNQGWAGLTQDQNRHALMQALT